MKKRHEKQRQRMAARNRAVRKFFRDHLEKNPQWRYTAVIELTADKFYLAENTIDAIISERPPYHQDDLDPEKSSG